MTDYSKMSLDELFAALDVAVMKTHHASQPGVPVRRQHKEVGILNDVGEEILRRDPSDYRPRFVAMLKAEHPALRYQAALILKHSDTELIWPVLLQLLHDDVGSGISGVRWTIRTLVTEGYAKGPVPAGC